MRTPDLIPASWRQAFYRHERRIAVVYLAAVSGLLLVVAVAPLRERVLYRVQILIRARQDHWADRVSRAEELVGAARWSEAEAALTRLDESLPAPTSRAALDRERERVLRALGQVYEGQGRRGRAIEAYQRLVAFDPRNYENHMALADAHMRLDGSWTIPVEARDAYAEALALSPWHLPALRGVLKYDFDRGDFPAVTARWEESLRSLLVIPITVRLDDSVQRVEVRADAMARDVAIDMSAPAGWSGRIIVGTRGWPGEWSRATVIAPLTAGTDGSSPRVTVAGPGAIAGGDSASISEVTLTPPPGGVARLVLHLRFDRPVDPALWTMISKSYRNQLLYDRLTASSQVVALMTEATVADHIEVPWP